MTHNTIVIDLTQADHRLFDLLRAESARHARRIRRKAEARNTKSALKIARNFRRFRNTLEVA